MDLQDRFLKVVNDNYDELMTGYKSYCHQQKLPYNEDIFGDTILKCYDALKRKKFIMDESERGLKNYFYQAVKMNALRELQYARNKKRTNNQNLKQDYERWYNVHNDDSLHKLRSDLYKDFATLYLMQKVEDNFDDEHFYLFRVKYLTDKTYNQLRKATNIRGAREKVIEVKNWLKDNVSKDEVKKAFLINFEKFL